MTRLTGTDLGRRQVRKLSDCHVASLIALTLGFVAHYHYGLSRLDIRTAALTGAAIFAVIFVLLAATEWIEKKSK